MTEDMKQKRDELARKEHNDLLSDRCKMIQLSEAAEAKRDAMIADQFRSIGFDSVPRWYADVIINIFNFAYAVRAEESAKQIEKLEAENAELREVIDELSNSMSAISDLSSHMKLAASLFAFKDGKITIPAALKAGAEVLND